MSTRQLTHKACCRLQSTRPMTLLPIRICPRRMCTTTRVRNTTGHPVGLVEAVELADLLLACHDRVFLAQGHLALMEASIGQAGNECHSHYPLRLERSA